MLFKDQMVLKLKRYIYHCLFSALFEDQSLNIFVALGSSFLHHFHYIFLSNVNDSKDFSAG